MTESILRSKASSLLCGSLPSGQFEVTAVDGRPIPGEQLLMQVKRHELYVGEPLALLVSVYDPFWDGG